MAKCEKNATLRLNTKLISAVKMEKEKRTHAFQTFTHEPKQMCVCVCVVLINGFRLYICCSSSL